MTQLYELGYNPLREQLEEFRVVYRDVDSDGDVWAENAYVFKSVVDLVKFFDKENPQLRDVFLLEDYQNILEIKFYRVETSQIPYMIEIEIKDSDTRKIREMGKAFFII